MKNLSFLIIILLALNACEDPIDVELQESETQIVVDAWLTNTPGQQQIRLTKSQPYFNNTFAEGITNANVIVTNVTSGDVYNFQESENGNYLYTLNPNQVLGEVNDEFELNIETNGERLSATSKLNDVPPVDSIDQEFRDDEVFLDDGIYCQFFARDLAGLGDTYWIKTFKNGEYLNRAGEINIAYDASFDSGGEVDNLVFIPPIREAVNPLDDDSIPIAWEPGETIRVEIHSITNEAFGFLEITRDQLLNSQSGIFAAPLSNTKGNIVNESSDTEVLGIFNVAGVSVREEVIREP
ncbi:MAG: DUF4249 domain-containing protein [Saprospiraceae bacterium]|nr:DUF4249 domain-containing protein [Bacteroidia bacterium]NNE16180.1 DUF4249 domain-containing protein [Saprospiraceae bacterium]NNL91610.1 DUF4249 domain-containing protein [Saprospiraceae bacterium]